MHADLDSVRGFMRRFPQGVTIITMRAGEVEHGMTASSVTLLSVDPLLFLVCVDKAARAHDILPRAGRFVVNVLSKDQAEACVIFARKELTDEERWPHVTTHRGESGLPRIDGCVGYLECRLVESFPRGTHTLYIGEIEDIAHGAGTSPLVWYDGGAHALTD